MILPPPEVIASWPAPNYVDPTTRGPALLILNMTFIAICTIMVALRLYTRLVVVRWFGWDDAFIILALLFSIAVNILVVLGSMKFGWDRHVWDIPLSWSEASLKLAYIAKLLFTFAAQATVLSLLAFYYRLIGDTNVRWFRYTLHCAVVFNVVVWLPFVFAAAFVCTPVKAYWSLPMPPGSHCLNEGLSTLIGGCAKTFVDLLVTTLPIPLIAQMKMTKRQKYGICILLGFGYIVTAAGALRTYYAYKLFYSGDYDLTWLQYPAFLASAVENDLGVICACVPALRPLYQPLFGPAINSLKTNFRNMSNHVSNNSKLESKNSRAARDTQSSSGDHSATHQPSASMGKRLVIEKRQSFELSGYPAYQSDWNDTKNHYTDAYR